MFYIGSIIFESGAMRKPFLPQVHIVVVVVVINKRFSLTPFASDRENLLLFRSLFT